jgi:hypothetical protein
MTPSIDLRDDVAVPEIELGLIEMALGDLELGLGLLDDRRVRRLFPDLPG